MTTPARQPPSVRDLAPLNYGGSIARSGFVFQDHVAVSFCFELLTNPELLEIWCETQDDITLIWRQVDYEEVEFVQVKGEEFDHLWTIAELCKREKTKNNPYGLGTSILERSLANDRCSETCRFRMVTSWQINRALKILSLPLSSPNRINPDKSYNQLCRNVNSKVNDFLSLKGNDSSFWLRNVWWQIEHSEDAIARRNIESLITFVEKLGWNIAPENARKHIYPKILGLVQDAAKTDWSIDPEKKKIKKKVFEDWLRSVVDDARYLALGTSGKKLREKMIDKASLPQSYFESALEERRIYRQAVLQQQYLDFLDRSLIEGEVYSELQHLLLMMDTGELDEGINFYKVCEEMLRELQSSLPSKTPPPLFFLKGCMHDITDRCGHRYHREAA